MTRIPQQPQSKGNRLRHFVGDGVWASVCEGIAEANFMAFGTAVSASAGKLSFLQSVQSLMGCVLQLWSERLIRILGTRKRLVVAAVSVQAAVLAFLALAALAGASPVLFFLLAFLYTGVGGLSGAVWNSWISDLLPSRRRGFCFAVRNRRTYPAAFVAMLAGGLVLHALDRALPGGMGVRVGFCTIFLFGVVAKAVSAWHLAMQPHLQEAGPLDRLAAEFAGAGPSALLSRCSQDWATRRILLFFGVLGLSVGISAAFTTPYLLKVLGRSYFEVTLCSAALIAARFVAAPYVGARLDRHGPRGLLWLSASLMPFCILGWMSHTFVVILLTQLASGVIWTAFDLSTFAYFAQNTPSRQRTTIFAARQVTWSFALAVGAAFGASVGSSYGLANAAFLVFGLSAAGRVLAPFILFTIPKDTVLLATAGEEQVAPAPAPMGAA